MIEQLFKSLESDYVQLRYRWTIFLQLFDSGENNIALLNSSGSNVFQLLQKILIDDTMLSLSRLSDPEKSAGKENASIYNYLKKVSICEEKKAQVCALLEELEKHMEPIRDTRKWAIAHSDLAVKLEAEPLPSVKYDHIESSIEVFQKIFNLLSGSNGDYTPHIPYGCDGNKLLSVLTKGHG